jgi:orotidine-5'-phosphate decarboxylase
VAATASDDISTLRNRLCIALDFGDPEECVVTAVRLGSVAGALKVGLQSFAAGGPDLVRSVREQAPVFLDLKLHDIPTQVASAMRSISGLGVSLTTVHAAGGRAMLTAAAESAAGSVTVLAVTVLTSLDEGDLRAAGIAGSIRDQVMRLADTALGAGLPGLVCSPLEVAAIRDRFGPRSEGGPLLVVPGIRPSGSEPDDQRRTMAPEEAVGAGADLIVVGRPILEAPDPVAAARKMAEQVA